MKKIELLLLLILMLYKNTFAQTIATTVRIEYVYEDDAENMAYDYYTKKKLIAKLFDQINLITNDSISFIKFQFNDEIKSGNNGYVYLSNQKEVDSFETDLTTAIESITQNTEFVSAIGKYQIDVKYKEERKKTIKTINIHETIGGSAYISLNQDGALKLLDWIKDIKL